MNKDSPLPMIAAKYKVAFVLLFSLSILFIWKKSFHKQILRLNDFHSLYDMDPPILGFVQVPLAKGEERVVKIHYKEMTPSKSNYPDMKRQIDVLILHGKKFTSNTWRDLDTLKVLAERGHRTVAIDLPGFGQSESAAELDGDDDDGFVKRAAFLKSLLTTLKMRRPAIVSPSMSGAFSLPLLLNSPDAFGAFVPVAPVHTAKFPSEIYMRTRVPTLIVVGDLDTNLGVISLKHLKNLPQHEILTLPNARHPAYLDQPDMFHAKLLSFLENLQDFSRP